MKTQILPSLLAADFGRLADEIRRVEQSGADALHLDIMDGHFVPNLSFGPDVVALARRVSPECHRHVHLMLTRPDLYVARFLEMGAQTIQIHVEADCDVHETLRAIRAGGARTGLVLRPQTPAQAVIPYLPLCDEILLMTVHPGYGGQSFMREVLPKIRAVRRLIGAGPKHVMVDGGISFDTAVEAAAVGADQFVAGSFLFKQQEMRDAVARMRECTGNAYGTAFGIDS